MPADIQLSGMEVSLVNAMSRETILRQYLDTLKGQYSHISSTAEPSLGMLTVNALAAANRIIIPVQAEYLSAKGLEQLLSTVNNGKAADQPQAPDRRYPADDGCTAEPTLPKRSPHFLRETYGRRSKYSAQDSPFCPGKGNQRRGKKHFCP